MPNDSIIENALRLFSLSFIPFTFVSILLFYYEGIERFVPAGAVSITGTLIGPLLFTFVLYQIMGPTGIWLSFLFGSFLALLVAILCSKFSERREKEYYGLFYIKKDLIPKTQNYAIENINDRAKKEMFEYLNSLNGNNSEYEKLDEILKYIFENNEDDIFVEILIINYDNHITINIKDEGKREIIINNAKFSNDEHINSSEVLGFNNVELTIPKK